MTTVETTKSQQFELSMDDAGILHLRWEHQAVIEATDAQEALKTINTLCGLTRHPLLVDMATIARVSREARAVFGGPCLAAPVALLGASPVDSVLAHFVLAMNKANRTKRFFTSQMEAMTWVSQHANR
ncbi:hypothetical protein SAMN05660916_02211 [Arthrobacter sp. 31Cvi3.1E]|nr:hypothetical protein SAMN05660916_02211 [Arthrobacter sp. 31Cvi3.1E]